ncbi:hypothetical protein V499_01266 [Pseudogymnoascus sp. VKM F-103]|uniref:Mid2 domain-containing protein n=1 Tax=Pseudogymnoascus verrucosus TaxID=342668 RepID=A0A1B8GNW9_9PEZI|nr:uncharacterized protein VE01_04533 [Pseudogymnoascus verrucosus]KFY79833.1 hypothetical protein V499_01266 [Pseudogymnoascus sp. VKM F-103]OBT97500.1 hypothetical protein VE01_04533 [Pseudogymnoascus verrucosus]
MFAPYFLFALCWSICLGSVAAGAAPLNSNLQIRNAPAKPSPETLWAIRRGLSSAVAVKNVTTFKGNTSLDSSWDGAVLFHYEDGAEKGNNLSVSASVDIICTTCYIKGLASVQFTIDGGFNFSEAVGTVKTEIGEEVTNITNTVVDYIKDSAKNVTQSVITGDFDGFDFPPFDVDFDIDIPKLPECNLKFQFDGLELYMEIDTILSGSATYTLNLYTSNTPIGFAVGKELLVGVVFSIDLIISVDAEIDISTGFHIQLNDGIAIDIHMFDHDVSSITFNGGNFEFLPVTLVGADLILTAILRLGIRSGLEFSTPTSFIGGIPVKFSTGIEAGVWADVAKLVTNVTAAPDREDCPLQVVEEYTMLVGANAGASLAIGEHSWGPEPSTQVPIWYTTLVDICAGAKTTAAAAAVTSVAVVGRDEGMTTTVTVVTQTAIVCLSTGLVECPASLQSAVKNVVTSTLIAPVPVGTAEAFPTTTVDAVVRTKAFGTGAKEIGATTGSPVSYVPTVSSTTTTSEPTSSGSTSARTDDNIIEGKTKGVSNKVIIGVSVGLGLPVLILIIAACFYCYKRQRYTPVQMTESPYIGGKSNFGTPESDNSGFDVAHRG